MAFAALKSRTHPLPSFARARPFSARLSADTNKMDTLNIAYAMYPRQQPLKPLSVRLPAQ